MQDGLSTYRSPCSRQPSVPIVCETTITPVVVVILLNTLMIAVSLSMDAFAVSRCVGTSGLTNDFKVNFRLAFHFGLFQTLMTLIGWFVGSTVANLINGICLLYTSE